MRYATDRHADRITSHPYQERSNKPLGGVYTCQFHEKFLRRYTGWRRGVVVSGVRRMNEVNARRARLVLDG